MPTVQTVPPGHANAPNQLLSVMRDPQCQYQPGHLGAMHTSLLVSSSAQPSRHRNIFDIQVTAEGP